MSCWSESNNAKKREELESRIKEMGGEVAYFIRGTGFNNLDDIQRKFNESKWVNGALSRRTNILFLGPIKITDLSPLADLININRLHLNNNKVSDLTPLAGLINITHLGLHRNKISDLSPLTGLTKITHLGSSNNEFSDLTPLYGLPELRELNVRNNPNLTKAEIDKLQKALPNCNINHNATK